MSIQIMQKSVLKYLPVLTYTKIDVREAFTVTIKAFTLAMCRLPLLLLVNIEVRKFDQYHRYLSLVSLRLQKVYPNTWILWFKRQMDLELIFYSIISLRTASWGKWTKFLKKIFGFSFSVFSTHTHRKPIHISSALITEHIHISSAKKFFRFQRTFRPYSITSSHVQNKAYIVTILHHRTLLIKLTLIKSLDHNYNTCSKLTLHHPTIPLHPPIFIHLQIRLGFQLPHVSPAFLSPVRKYVLSSISNYIWNTSKLLLFPGKVETNTIPQTIDQDPVFCSICSDRIYRGIRQDTVPYAPTKTVMRDAIKPAVVYLQAKVAIRKILVALSPGNALNIVLVSPKLSSHLPQFMSFQVVLLLQANLAPYVRILFDVSMPTELTIVQIHPEIMSVTLQLRTVALQIPEELQKLAFSLIELGSVIYILQHQQLDINQLNLTLHLHVPQRYH